MKKRNVYVLSCLLAGVVLAGSLGACGSDKDETGRKGSESAEASADAEKKNTESVKETESAEETETEETQEKKYETITSDASVEDYNSVVVVDKSAYELFTYREDVAESYAAAVNKLGKKLDGKAQVYDMLIPLSSSVTFPDNLQDKIKSTDQREAMEKVFGMVHDPVKSIDIYDSLMSHRTEYIYFRTDHHWTALGAYYAYEDFCQAKGIEPADISSYETKEFDGFIGSFYNDTKAQVLKDNPDTVVAYVPKSDATIHVTASDGTEYDWEIIYDVSSYASSLKYSTFVAADNPISVIENKNVADGSSCIVVKESFGNAFIPFLVDHYQTIYIVDYRYYTGNVSDLVDAKKVDDVILMNNLSMLRNQYLVGQFQGVVK